MKVSENWLREWVNPNISTEELVAQITMAGLEVDGVEPAAGSFSNVVVGKIAQIEQHPDADKLRVCQVEGGEQELTQVVCGAANARVGIKIPFAMVGAVLPGDFKIKKAKLRGVESFGMLCGASELGMEDKIDGLMELADDAPVGADVREYLKLDDQLIDVDLTPNRGDCLSALGVAREVAVLNKLPLTMPNLQAVAASTDTTMAVELKAQEDCPSYACRVIENIDINAPTPLWMAERLRRGGVRSIDAVVDVTNYVLLEFGQPMHAFDADKLSGNIVVRKAATKEKLTLLDDQELELNDSDLVIADSEKALALAGIMGGAQSAVGADTKNIVLESAFFTPEKIAGRARSYGLHTDSSHRFERGVDGTQQVRAIERATELLLDIVGGQAGPVVEKTATKQSLKVVTLSAKRLEQVLGMCFELSDVTEMFERLGFEVNANAEGWECVIPSWRFDIAIEADLIEEVARVYGYNNLPTRQLYVPVNFVPRKEAQTPLQRVQQHLLSRDYQEAITYSFIDTSQQQWFCDETPVAVQNPISSDMSVMRTSLLPGLIQAMQHNNKRQISRVRLFETGLQFHQKADVVEQKQYLAGIATGTAKAEGWTGDDRSVDFYDVKGDIESLLLACGHTLQSLNFSACERKGLHPGQSAAITIAGEEVGFIGLLHPQLTKSLNITGNTLVFELSLDAVCMANVCQFKALSKYPQVRRDLAIVIKDSVNAADIEQSIIHTAAEFAKANKADNLLQRCNVFDVYKGASVEEGHKSLALGLFFQHIERSLQDEEVQQLVDAIVAQLVDNFGAILRN